MALSQKDSNGCCVEKTSEKVKRNKPGQPAKDEKPEYRTLYKVYIQLGELDEIAYEREKEHLSCFVLISNIFHGYSASEILKEYKEQSVVENRFKFVKHPFMLAPCDCRKKNGLKL
ncbi:MAG: hypothetical protein PWR14_655 [Thermosediminibacterales bacterium]|nr:hypothetical protein [Thermosediminibacterales bacterium]